MRVMLLVLIFCVSFAYGFVVAHRRVFPYGLIRHVYVGAADRGWVERTPGRWRLARDHAPGSDLTEAERADTEKLGTLGYLGAVRPAGEQAGITVYDRDLAYDGLNLFISGHAPEATLMDMDGEVLHRWTIDFRSVWPDWKGVRGHPGTEHWGYVHLREDGGLLAVFDWLGLIRLDRDSNVLWSYAGRSHHDLFVTDEGMIYALDLEDRTVPWNAEDRSIADNFITVLTLDGEVQRRVSIFDALARSEYAPILWRVRGQWDVLHTNTVEVLDGKHEHILPAFRKGNVLVSFRALDTIAVIDMETEAVVWAQSGKWRAQHNPTFLENGRLLIFNNIAGDEVSEVLEFDPLTLEVFWLYRGSETVPFFSRE